MTNSLSAEQVGPFATSGAALRRIGLAALLVLICACGSHPVATFELSLGIRLIEPLSLEAIDRTPGGPCQGSGAYSDIRNGAQVVFKDGQGKVIGTSQLANGVAGTGTVDRSGFSYPCGFRASPLKLPKEDFYTLQVSQRPPITYSFNDLQAKNWQLSVTIGGN
jgi:hypothetical protein